MGKDNDDGNKLNRIRKEIVFMMNKIVSTYFVKFILVSILV